jgi:Tol biopolymer transport system component|tara:strand:- start:237 stop:1130 length:894 start_codon:yes stop_codon:yes gene_type:complete
MLPFEAQVCVMHPSGEVHRISPGSGIFYQSCIHPDGTQVVYGGASSGPPRVWCAEATEYADPIPLTPADSGACHPVFSWDGTQIAFSSDRTSSNPPKFVENMNPQAMPDQGNIFIIESDGREIQITEGPYLDQRPCFSPDGSRVVFVSNRVGGLTLWSVTVTGESDPEPLPYQGSAYRPWFSTDGRTVFFISGVDDLSEARGRHQICRVGLLDSEASPLDNDDHGRSHGPFADPNGEMLLMHSTRGQDKEAPLGHFLWELPLDGSAPRKLDIPGIAHPMHGTRSRNGVLAFDTITRR